MSITTRLNAIRETLPEGVALLAISKFHPAEAVQEAYDAGQRLFGESRAQELCAKQQCLPKDIEWHFIGTLQRNKVKDIVPFVHTIQSIDSVRLMEEVERQAAKCGRKINALMEVHLAQEDTKHGFSVEECQALLDASPAETYPHVRICGLMGMATNTDCEATIRSEFARLKQLKDANPTLQVLSMGMSDDYPIAIEEGSTMVRVGSSIFGHRG